MIEFGDCRYDSESRILYRDGEEILLPPRVLAVLESLLKRPGKVVVRGVFGIVELDNHLFHDDEDLHRLNWRVAVAEFVAGGFEHADSSDILRNPDDDHRTGGWGARHEMDRFLLKFRKPR